MGANVSFTALNGCSDDIATFIMVAARSPSASVVVVVVFVAIVKVPQARARRSRQDPSTLDVSQTIVASRRKSILRYTQSQMSKADCSKGKEDDSSENQSKVLV